tara:strand:- start:1270 stop:1659 length:390 start_codon:yes stop_codon:yes gene_type:complete
MATKTQRAWFVDKLGKIGIVEKSNNAVTKNGFTTDWKSITVAKTFRIYAISRENDLSSNDLSNTFNQIPEQFHESIVSKVIASGYKDPRNIDINTAQYFDSEYIAGVKEGKKFSKSNYTDIGHTKAQDF